MHSPHLAGQTSPEPARSGHTYGMVVLMQDTAEGRKGGKERGATVSLAPGREQGQALGRAVQDKNLKQAGRLNSGAVPSFV